MLAISWFSRKMVRVRWLDSMARDAMGSGDYKLAIQSLAQIARELDPRYATKNRNGLTRR